MINDILDFSKLEYGKLETEKVPFLTAHCFEEPVTMLASSAHDKGLELILLLYEDVPKRLLGDEGRIKQILVNIIGNAIKFTQRGEVVVRVMLEEETERFCTLRISVPDTGIGIGIGIGIPEHSLRSLFTSFQQASASTSRVYGGTGLGLSISKKLAETMHGSIRAESDEGSGSCFTITLRLDKAPDAPCDAPENTTGATRCMLLDNHHLSRLALRHRLEGFGFEVSDSAAHEWHRIGDPGGYDFAILGIGATELHEDFSPALDFISSDRSLPVLALASTSDYQELARIRTAHRITRATQKPGNGTALLREIHALFNQPSPDRPREADAPLPPDLEGVRILIADDHPVNLRLCQSLFAPTGAELTTVADGGQAMEQFTRHPHDLVLLDVHMPVLNGREVAARIRELDGDLRHTPVIALTADVMPEHRDEMIAAGIDEYLTKPVDEGALWQTIATLLGTTPPSGDDPPRLCTLVATPRESGGDSPTRSRDRDEAIRVAGGDRAPAESLYREFSAGLEEEISKLQSLHQAGERLRLREQSHRLHGAAAVCGVPQLRRLVAELERNAEDGDGEWILRHLERIRDEARILRSLDP
ncbi:MAG: response regulator [gamma proteobacterium symbiont of Phacoides pectinatus]